MDADVEHAVVHASGAAPWRRGPGRCGRPRRTPTTPTPAVHRGRSRRVAPRAAPSTGGDEAAEPLAERLALLALLEERRIRADRDGGEHRERILAVGRHLEDGDLAARPRPRARRSPRRRHRAPIEPREVVEGAAGHDEQRHPVMAGDTGHARDRAVAAVDAEHHRRRRADMCPATASARSSPSASSCTTLRAVAPRTPAADRRGARPCPTGRSGRSAHPHLR